MKRAFDVVVVGGGVVGATSAYYLVRRGFRVALLDAGREPNRESASYGNGGQLSWAFADALASPKILRALPRVLRGADAGLRVTRSGWLSMRDLGRWGALMVQECSTARWKQHTSQLLSLAVESREELERIVEQETQMAFDYQPRAGKVILMRSAAELEAAHAGVELKNRWGHQQRVVDREELLRLEPQLEGCPVSIVGGVYSPLEATGDAHRWTEQLLRLAGEAGATVERGVRVCGEERSSGGTVTALLDESGQRWVGERFVYAVGAASAPLLRQLRGSGWPPVYPVKGYSLTVPRAASAPMMSVTDLQSKSLVCVLGDRVRVTGFAEFAGWDRSLPEERLTELREIARSLLPAAGHWDTRLDAWVGLRPMSPDSVPLIGAMGQGSNVYLNCGQGSLGWTLAAGSAAVLYRSIIGDARPSDAAYAPDRW